MSKIATVIETPSANEDFKKDLISTMELALQLVTVGYKTEIQSCDTSTEEGLKEVNYLALKSNEIFEFLHTTLNQLSEEPSEEEKKQLDSIVEQLHKFSA